MPSRLGVFQLRRTGQSPGTVFRNAFLVTFIIFLALYPVLDKSFGWGKMGAFPTILIYTVLALGLNIVVGFAGLLDLGYAAFFAIGGYTAAFLTSPQSPLFGIFQTNFYVAMALSFLVAATFGIILGAPTLRLRGDYLAIVTLAFGEIVPRAFLNLEQWTKGSKGINPIGRPTIPWLHDGQLTTLQLSNSDQTPWYYLIFVVGCLSVFAIYRLANSRIGRVSGFAGSLWASMLQLIDPFQFDFSISIVVLSMIILGGIGNIWGVVFGGVVLGFYDRVLTSEASNWLHGLGTAINLPQISPWLATVDLTQYKFGIFGLALVILMLTRPEGIFPNRQRAVEMHGGEDIDPIDDQLGEEGLLDRPLGGVRA